VDIVLNSLAGEFVDASLRLLPRGGRFLEMGLTDLREQGELVSKYRGVAYMPFELVDVAHEKPEEIQRLLKQVVELFELEVLKPLPVVVYDLRHVSAAFRHMAQGRHVGKQVVQLPRRLAAGGTVLITGGVGELGREVAHRMQAAAKTVNGKRQGAVDRRGVLCVIRRDHRYVGAKIGGGSGDLARIGADAAGGRRKLAAEQ